jgi:hypothetical protein
MLLDTFIRNPQSFNHIQNAADFKQYLESNLAIIEHNEGFYAFSYPDDFAWMAIAIYRCFTVTRQQVEVFYHEYLGYGVLIDVELDGAVLQYWFDSQKICSANSYPAIHAKDGWRKVQESALLEKNFHALHESLLNELNRPELYFVDDDFRYSALDGSKISKTYYESWFCTGIFTLWVNSAVDVLLGDVPAEQGKILEVLNGH